MDHAYLLTLRRTNAAWRLLAADHAPLIIGFLHHAFIVPNIRAIAQGDLEARLDDYLAYLRQDGGGDFYTRPASEYLNRWAEDNSAFLRRYYPPQGDEPYYDLTPASEKAIQWLAGMEQRAFVGTESRLLTVIELLRDIARVAETDPQKRIAELEQRKQAIELEINEIEHGRFTPGDPRQIKERFFEAEDMARRLLSDFRQVEDNFRQLDRAVRERIATASTAKGSLLDEVFGERDAITDSDQGRSFAAFWTLLMSPKLQEELAGLIEKLLAVSGAQEDGQATVLARIQDHLLGAGERVQHNNAALIEQLRRFLDDQVWLENKRIMELIHEVEAHALAVRDNPPREKGYMHVGDVRADLKLPLARGLFRLPQPVTLDLGALLGGEPDIDTNALFNTHYIDQAVLCENVREALRGRSQVTLGEVCAACPIEKGLAEVVGYIHLAAHDDRAIIGQDQQEAVQWYDPQGMKVELRIPKVIFTE